VSGAGAPTWSFLTNHARVLLCIAQDADIRLREIGDRVGITERAAHRIVAELAVAGYIRRTRDGRRNRYTIQPHLPIPDPVARDQSVGDLLAVLVARETPGPDSEHAEAPSTSPTAS
jgi:predicted transcriptional regulator